MKRLIVAAALMAGSAQAEEASPPKLVGFTFVQQLTGSMSCADVSALINSGLHLSGEKASLQAAYAGFVFGRTLEQRGLADLKETTIAGFSEAETFCLNNPNASLLEMFID